MAKFCNQCGRPLAEGEVCTCRQNVQQGGNVNQQNSYQQNSYQQNTYQQNDYQQNAYQQNTYQQSGAAAPQFTHSDDGIPFKKLIGIGESDQTTIDGCFERGLKITPELVAPCENEQHVKQYELCSARSRLRGLWQEGRLQVTNKRILFRLSGRSWIGRAMDHTEFDIDEIAGVQISDGVRFGIWDFLLSLIIVLPILSALFFKIGSVVGIIGFLLGIASWAPLFLFRKKYFIKFASLSAGVGCFAGAMMAWYALWVQFFAGITLIAAVITLFLFSLKPSLSIKVMTKCASDSPIFIWSRQNMASVMEILPGKDAQAAIQELGAMINDIQKFGDFGLEKWKED